VGCPTQLNKINFVFVSLSWFDIETNHWDKAYYQCIHLHGSCFLGYTHAWWGTLIIWGLQSSCIADVLALSVRVQINSISLIELISLWYDIQNNMCPCFGYWCQHVQTWHDSTIPSQIVSKSVSPFIGMLWLHYEE